MKSEVNDVVHRVELAERIVLRLRSALHDCSDERAEERDWLAAAEARLAATAIAVREELEKGIALPEFKAVREERLRGLEQEWLDALLSLFQDLLNKLGETSPLIEALFPHRRFEKLERGGPVQRAYRAQFAPRRASSYVRRMAADPDYDFLPPLLERVDRAAEALAVSDSADQLDPDDATDLRAAIVRSGEVLSRSLRQARCLSEAALIDAPERFTALGFDERPRKRPAQPAEERAAD